MKNNTMIPYNPKKDLETNYYNKTEVELLVAGGSGGSIDLSNYYKKLETYSKAQVDALVAGGGADLSDYYTKAQVDSLISAIPETDLTNYYNKTQVDSLIPDISTKQDTLVSGTNIKTINGESVLGSGDLVISGGGAVDLSEYYKKTETYNKVEVDTKIDDIPTTDLSNYYNKTETETLLSNKVDKVAGKGLSTNDFTNTFKQAYDGHLASTSNPHNVTASQVGAYSKSENDNLLVKKANLDINNKIPLSEIPDSILGQLKYMGVWNFSSGLPTGAQKGNYWIASVSGNGYEVGDWAVYNGTSFDKVDNTDAVSSVAGRTGNITLTKNDVGLSNVTNETQEPTANKKTDIEANKASNTFFPTIKAVYDWAKGLFVEKNTAITGATKTKITYDSKGLVTAGADLIESDIPALSISKTTGLQTALDTKLNKNELPATLSPIIMSGQVGNQGNVTVGKIPFGEIWVNIGGISYNPTTRRFTVPQAGTYRITMNPFKSYASALARVLVGINTDAPTAGVNRGHTYADGSTYSTMSINSVVNLSANDYIVFYLSEGDLYNASNDRFNQFAIERIA